MKIIQMQFFRCTCLENDPAPTEVVDCKEAVPISRVDEEVEKCVVTEVKAKDAEAPLEPVAQAKEERPRMLVLDIAKVASTDELGAALDVADNCTFVIDNLESGLLSIWNMRNPTKAVSPGDRIFSVNGVKGNIQAMLDKIRGDMQLTMEVVQPKTLEFSIKRDDNGLLGFELSLLPKKSTVVIRALKDGPLSDWARVNNQKLSSGDRIVSANGVSGNADKIAKALVQSNSAGEIALVMWRYG